MRTCLLLLLTLFTALPLTAQDSTFSRTYTGWWASTSWQFDFRHDGIYVRHSSGHFGLTELRGTYRVKGDTLYILSNYENSNGTVNRVYWLDPSGYLVDMDLRYDYKLVTPEDKTLNFYSSRVRQVKYPQIPPRNEQERHDLETALNVALNQGQLEKYWKAEGKPRPLYLAEYMYLNREYPLNLRIQGRPVQILPDGEIPQPFAIVFEDINIQQDQISLTWNLRGDDVRCIVYLTRMRQSWQIQYSDVY